MKYNNNNPIYLKLILNHMFCFVNNMIKVSLQKLFANIANIFIVLLHKNNKKQEDF